MKTPKASTPIVKSKLKTPKHGMVRKSLGSTPVSKVNLSTIKGKDQALSVIEDNEDSVQLVNKNNSKKARLSLPAKLLDKNETKDGFKSPKTPKGKGFNVSSSGEKNVNDSAKNKKGSPVSEESENNSSPVKQGSPKANKGKIPFSLDKGGSPKQRGSMSPEVQLGLQLEKALSPQTLGKKRKGVFDDKESGAKKRAVGKQTKKKKKMQKFPRIDQASAESIFQLANVKAAVTSFLKMKSKSTKDVSQVPKNEQKVSVHVSLQKNSLFKKIKKNFFKLKLAHSILPVKPRACLIAADLKDKKDDPDASVAFYEDLLKQKGVNIISQIIPISHFQKKYSEPEKMKKFCDQFDMIFIEGKIVLVGRIGMKLSRFNQNVILINLNFPVLKEYLEASLYKSTVTIANLGESISVQCGRLDTGKEQLIENIVEVGRYLGAGGPVAGTRQLVSTVSLVSPLSQPVPFYHNPHPVTSGEAAEEGTKKLGKKETAESQKEAKPDSKLPNIKENNKKGKLKKPLEKVQEKEEEDEEESDVDEESGSEDESGLDMDASSGEEEEGSDDDSEEEELDEEVDSNEEEEGEGNDEESSEEEAIISEKEKEYLTELRKDQDHFEKERSNILKKNKGGKPDAPNDKNVTKQQKPGKQQNENKNQNKQQNQNRQLQNQKNQQKKQNSPNFGRNKKQFGGGGGNKFGGKPQNQNSRNNQQSPNQKSKFEKKNFSKFSKPQGNQQNSNFKKNFNKNK